LGPRLRLTNVPSVKGEKGWRNFGKLPPGEVVRRIPLPRTPVNRAATREGSLGGIMLS
jgi:hypothetical protein